jgi:hypothetical protein
VVASFRDERIAGETRGAVSRQALEEVLARAMEDNQFRGRMLREPAEALDGYDLSPQERQALIAGDLRQLLLTVEAPKDD